MTIWASGDLPPFRFFIQAAHLSPAPPVSVSTKVDTLEQNLRFCSKMRPSAHALRAHTPGLPVFFGRYTPVQKTDFISFCCLRNKTPAEGFLNF